MHDGEQYGELVPRLFTIIGLSRCIYLISLHWFGDGFASLQAVRMAMSEVLYSVCLYETACHYIAEHLPTTAMDSCDANSSQIEWAEGESTCCASPINPSSKIEQD
jgi:hypothetical protein